MFGRQERREGGGSCRDRWMRCQTMRRTTTTPVLLLDVLAPRPADQPDGVREPMEERCMDVAGCYKHLEVAEPKCEDRSTLELIEPIRVLLKIIEPPSVNLRVKRMDTPPSKPFHARRRTVQGTDPRGSRCCVDVYAGGQGLAGR